MLIKSFADRTQISFNKQKKILCIYVDSMVFNSVMKGGKTY